MLMSHEPETVIHECKDYAAWKKSYDADAQKRAAAGLAEFQPRESSEPRG